MVEVDCTAGGERICSTAGVRGYPTLKYFTPTGPKGGSEYNGGRDFNSIKQFADEKLVTCNVATLKGCQPNQVEFIKKNKDKPPEEIGAALKEKETALADLKKERTKLRNELTDKEKNWSRNERNLNKAIALIKQIEKHAVKNNEL